MIRDFSLLSQGLTGGISEAFRQISEVAIRGLQLSLFALGGTFALTAKSGADFEDEMIRAFTILKEGGNAMIGSLSMMTNQALTLGRETLFSAIQAAQGMQILARAGFNTREVLDSIRPTLDLAIVGNIELAESTNIVISALRGFNLETREAGKVADILALGSSKANTTIQELGTALSYVAPVAAGAGLAIEETVAAIGILANAGIKGGRAGTTLRRALSQLLAPSRKAKKVMDELGVSFVSSEGKLKPFVTIVRDLEMAGMNASQAMQMFGLRAGPGMIALVNAGANSVSNLANSLENAKGTAEDMSQAFRTTVKGRVRDLMASVVDLGLAFSENFKKPLADSIFAVRNFIVNLVNVGNRMGIFRSIIKGVKTALEPIADLIKKLSGAFKKWVSELTPRQVSKFFSDLREDIAAFVTSLTSGELGAIMKDTFKVIIGLGKMLLNTIKGISKAWMSLPEGIRDSIRPMVIISALIIKLFGGVMNLIFLFVALSAVLGSIGLKISLWGLAFVGIKAVLVFIAGAVAVIGALLIGWNLIKFVTELSFVKSLVKTLYILFKSLGPTIKLAAMSMLALGQPWRLLNEDFRKEWKNTATIIANYGKEIASLDWLGLEQEKSDLDKIKDGVVSIGDAAKKVKDNIVGMFKGKVDIEIKKPETVMKMDGVDYTGFGPKKTKQDIYWEEQVAKSREDYKKQYDEDSIKRREESQRLLEENRARKGIGIGTGGLTGLDEDSISLKQMQLIDEINTLQTELKAQMGDKGVYELTDKIISTTDLLVQAKDALREELNKQISRIDSIYSQGITKTDIATKNQPRIGGGLD